MTNVAAASLLLLDVRGFPIPQHFNPITGMFEHAIGDDNATAVIPYTEAIAMGLIAGHEEFGGFGERAAITVVVGGNDLWGGVAAVCPIPDQIVGEQMTLVSSSLNDAAAGTGVQTIDVHGLDADGNEQSEIVTLNGTTPVNTVRTNWRFNQAIHGERWGALDTADGTISIYRTGDATRVYNVIAPGSNMSLNSARMIPAGKTFFLTNLSMTAADNTSVSVRLRSTSTFEHQLTAGMRFLFKSLGVLQNSPREKRFSIPKKFPALSIIKATAYATTNGASASVEYDGWIE